MDINPNSIELLNQRLHELYIEESSWKRVATRLGVSASYLSDIINGHREAGPKILTQLKLRLVGFYLEAE